MLKYSAFQQPTVAAQLSHQVESDQLERQDAFMRQLSSLKYWVRQGLAVRGHVEDGNLQQLVKYCSEDVASLE